jgi:hypothetical protein
MRRLTLVNRQLADAEAQLDRLCKKLTEPVTGMMGERAGTEARAS